LANAGAFDLLYVWLFADEGSMNQQGGHFMPFQCAYETIAGRSEVWASETIVVEL